MKRFPSLPFDQSRSYRFPRSAVTAGHGKSLARPCIRRSKAPPQESSCSISRCALFVHSASSPLPDEARHRRAQPKLNTPQCRPLHLSGSFPPPLDHVAGVLADVPFTSPEHSSSLLSSRIQSTVLRSIQHKPSCMTDTFLTRLHSSTKNQSLPPPTQRAEATPMDDMPADLRITPPTQIHVAVLRSPPLP